jgi:hypothetical protein
MADTQRTRAALQTLFADNVTGQISPQDLRDFLVTAMQPEFVNENDFWCEPLPDQITTDETTRGYHLYSQVTGSLEVSFGMVYALNSINEWSDANASASAHNYFLAVAADSYNQAGNTGSTDCKMLIKGIVMDETDRVNQLTGYIGYPLFLASEDDYSIQLLNLDGWSRYVGRVLPAGVGSVQTKGKWYFDPEWEVTGV